jgi:hypothetical protein
VTFQPLGFSTRRHERSRNGVPSTTVAGGASKPQFTRREALLAYPEQGPSLRQRKPPPDHPLDAWFTSTLSALLA